MLAEAAHRAASNRLRSLSGSTRQVQEGARAPSPANQFVNGNLGFGYFFHFRNWMLFLSGWFYIFRKHRPDRTDLSGQRFEYRETCDAPADFLGCGRLLDQFRFDRDLDFIPYNQRASFGQGVKGDAEVFAIDFR